MTRVETTLGAGTIPAPDDPVRANDMVTPEHRAKVQEAAQKFESFFIAQMLRQMRSSTREMAGEDSVFNSRTNQDMLDMADVAFADALAGHRAFGIADVIVRQLLPASQATLPVSLKPAANAVASE